ncbi:UDP-glucose 6-dehydrogenase 4-like [Triticum dicoccoides]|uniref:UDP-glucose 6-dehydrogenase 4-like n=1 Tax=Triticum dicoccoides TaxID=85692 RepID=UPI00188F98C1|nr:UDP-glucose 6-dehydrogenase 4-like [Triticum dicoccoides]
MSVAGESLRRLGVQAAAATVSSHQLGGIVDAGCVRDYSFLIDQAWIFIFSSAMEYSQSMWWRTSPRCGSAAGTTATGSIYEPGLEDVIKLCRGHNLFFNTDVGEVDIVFFFVNTDTETLGLGADKAAHLLRGRHLCNVIEVAYSIGKDSHIGPRLLSASVGLRGSCFPPAIDVCRGLLENEAVVSIYDSQVTKEQVRRDLAMDKFDWNHPRHLQPKPAYVFDGRNIVDLEKLQDVGFIFYGIGKLLDQ